MLDTPMFRFRFSQIDAKRHLIEAGSQKGDAINWGLSGERTRDQLVELRNRIKSPSMSIPLVIDELAAPLPKGLGFAPTAIHLRESDEIAELLKNLESYLEFSKNLENQIYLLREKTEQMPTSIGDIREAVESVEHLISQSSAIATRGGAAAMKKSLLDRFHDLNLQMPIKKTVVAGGFLLLVAIVGGLFSLGVAWIGKPSAPVQTRIVPQSVEQQVSPFEFTQAVIRSLATASDARETILSTTPTGELVADTLQDMTNTRIGINKLIQANGEFERFRGSNEERIALAVRGFETAYKGLIDALEDGLKTQETLIGISDQNQLGPLLGELSKSAAQADMGWKMLMYATVVVAHILTDNERLDEDGTLGYLSITAAQRAELLKELESYFGESVKKGMAAGQYPTEAAPASLWEFLHREGWKPSDSP